MEYYMQLPRSKKEFALFMAVISIVSVNIIAPLITFSEMGFSLYIWSDTIKSIPFVWAAVIALVLITYKPAERLTRLVVKEDGSFAWHITINIFFTVVMMSIFLTVLGTWIGTRRISMDPIYRFFNKWPRNFTISLFVEMCVAQPLARFVMIKYHQYTDSKTK